MDILRYCDSAIRILVLHKVAFCDFLTLRYVSDATQNTVDNTCNNGTIVLQNYMKLVVKCVHEGVAVVPVSAQLVSQVIYCLLTTTRIDSFKIH